MVKMYSTHFLVCIFSVFISQTYCDDQSDEPAVTNDELFGKGNTCHFVYEGFNLDDIKQEQTPNAKLFGIGRLLQHRLDFILQGGYITAVPDKDEEIWGIAVTLPAQEYMDYSKKKGSILSGKKVGRNVVKTVELTVNDKPLKVDCNVGVAINQPEKISPLPEDRRPEQAVLNNLVDVCVTSKFPQCYCDKLRKTPTKDC